MLHLYTKAAYIRLNVSLYPRADAEEPATWVDTMCQHTETFPLCPHDTVTAGLFACLVCLHPLSPHCGLHPPQWPLTVIWNLVIVRWPHCCSRSHPRFARLRSRPDWYREWKRESYGSALSPSADPGTATSISGSGIWAHAKRAHDSRLGPRYLHSVEVLTRCGGDTT